MKIHKSTIRLLIREAIEQIFEADIQYGVGDRVEIDSSYGGGIGTVELSRHPFYAIKFDKTGTTDSFHFSDLRPFNDEEEEEKNKDINTGLEENTELNTDDVVATIKKSNMTDDAKQLIFKAYKSGKITAKSAIKIIEKTAKPKINENINSPDVISLDVPLFIRMLEYAREDAKTDMDLHDVTEKAISLSITGRTLNMTDYNNIIGNGNLNEGPLNKIFHIEGIIITDDTNHNQADIISDIRSLPGITVVRSKELPQDPTSKYFKSNLEIKIDPYPYVKQGKFDPKTTIEKIINNIKKVNGVINFKQTVNTYSTGN